MNKGKFLSITIVLLVLLVELFDQYYTTCNYLQGANNVPLLNINKAQFNGGATLLSILIVGFLVLTFAKRTK